MSQENTDMSISDLAAATAGTATATAATTTTAAAASAAPVETKSAVPDFLAEFDPLASPKADSAADQSKAPAKKEAPKQEADILDVLLGHLKEKEKQEHEQMEEDMARRKKMEGERVDIDAPPASSPIPSSK